MKLIDVIVVTLCVVGAAVTAIVMVIKFAPLHLRKKIIMGIGIGLLGVIILSVGGTAVVMTNIPTRLSTQYQSAPRHYRTAKPIGEALVIYQPAWTDITQNAADALAESLQDKGYDVTVNYPGSFLPHDVSEYAVLVFGTPIYNSKGSPLVVDYMESLKGLSDKKVILFTTGSDTPIEKDRVYDGIENHRKGISSMQRIKFSNKTNNKQLADITVKKLCEKQ